MKNLTVLTFKTLDTVFYVCCGKVTLARCIKTGRFVKLNKVKRVFQNLLIVAKKYVEQCKDSSPLQDNKGGYIAAKNMFNNALKFFGVSSHVVKGRNYYMLTKNILTMLVA